MTQVMTPSDPVCRLLTAQVMTPVTPSVGSVTLSHLYPDTATRSLHTGLSLLHLPTEPSGLPTQAALSAGLPPWLPQAATNGNPTGRPRKTLEA